MTSSNYKRQNFEKDCQLLIKTITDFNENEENFTLCLDFALSNLLYHSYLDVNTHQVNRCISGLYEKFLIHSDLEKANKFKTTSDKLLHIFDKKNGLQKENSYGILAFLLYLSNSSNLPSSGSSFSIKENSECEDKSIIDWASYLRDDDDRYYYSEASSESFTSDEDSLEDLETVYLHPPPRDDSGLGISPDSCSGGSQQQFQINNNCLVPVHDDLIKSPLETVEDKLFYLYWMSKYQQSCTKNPYKLKTMNFTKLWEQYMVEQSFPPVVPKVIMHERNVVKEVLWMLHGMKDLFLFQWDGYQFAVNPVVHLCNLTSVALGFALKPFCEYGAKSVFLHSFLEEALFEDPREQNFCLTFHTYTVAIQKQLQKITDSITDLEKRLMLRKETFTILNLMEKCRAFLYDIDEIYYLNHDVLEAIPLSCDPFEKACRLLHVLWQHLSHLSVRDRSSSSLKIILTVFLETCVPFFSFLESLALHGTFKDTHGEFFCCRKDNVLVTDTEFWESGLMLKDLPSDIQDDFFLKPYFNEIIVAGKSIEILNQMHSLMKIPPFRLNVEKGELYSKFILILHKLLNKTSPQKLCLDIPSNDVNEIVPASCDPLLKQKIFSFHPVTERFFLPEVNPVYMPVVKMPFEVLFTESQICTEKAIEDLSPKSLKPVTEDILKAFEICVKYAYYPTCHRLIKALREKYDLMTHMNVMQKYFLMESGDLMFSFYSKVFEKMFYNEPWQDVSSLYSVLQNAISEDEENCEKLCVFLDTSNSDLQMLQQPLSLLNRLQLSYEVKWPVSIMLGSSIQSQYCQIFSFLLQIKAAKYLLDELHFIRLNDSGRKPKSKLTTLASKFVFSREQKIHGMYIIRTRLMYFVNGLHNYIMTRILYSFGLEFNTILENAQTVEDMIEAHNNYLKSLHERCFLDRRLPHLREQIFQVLNLCYSFQRLWLRGVDSISLDELEDVEVQFSKCSNFLSSYFNSLLRRGVYCHLENLVSSMMSETHNLHIFKVKKSTLVSRDRLKK